MRGFARLLKMNPYHDEHNGQFTTAPESSKGGVFSAFAASMAQQAQQDGIMLQSQQSVAMQLPAEVLNAPVLAKDTEGYTQYFQDAPSGSYLPTEMRDQYHALENATKEWYAKLGRDEKLALDEYTNDTTIINKAAAAMTKGDARELAKHDVMEHTVHVLDGMLANSSIPENIKVFRGMAGKYLAEAGLNVSGLFKPVDSNAFLEARKELVGKVYTENGFASTSLKKGTYFAYSKAQSLTGKVGLNIQVPAGSKGLFLGPISHVISEEEVLLPRGSKFAITGVSKTETNLPTLNVKLVG